MNYYLLTAILIFLTGYTHASQMRILWWNIMDGGSHANYLEKKSGVNPINYHLTKIITSPNKPDLLILSEFEQLKNNAAFIKTLKTHYPFQQFISFNDSLKNNGMMIFSQQALKITHSRILDWSSDNERHLRMSEYIKYWKKLYPKIEENFPRRATLLEVEVPHGPPLLLVPFHACQPWSHLKQRKNMFSVAHTLLFKNDHPLYHQIQHLKQWLETLKKNSNLIILGDFNIPSSWGGIVPTTYELLNHGLQSFWSKNASATYPTPDFFKDYFRTPLLTIDHAFYVGRNIKNPKAESFAWLGSDHYPLNISFDYY